MLLGLKDCNKIKIKLIFRRRKTITKRIITYNASKRVTLTYGKEFNHVKNKFWFGQ